MQIAIKSTLSTSGHIREDTSFVQIDELEILVHTHFGRMVRISALDSVKMSMISHTAAFAKTWNGA